VGGAGDDDHPLRGLEQSDSAPHRWHDASSRSHALW